MSKSKNWCFTINNYTEETVERLLSLQSIAAYLIFGREVGEQGTPHLQGFVSFPSRKGLQTVSGYLGGAHCSIAKYISASIKYCKKEGNFTEIGEPPGDKRQGKRSDLEAFKEDVKDGMTDLAVLMEVHSGPMARYPRFCERYVRMNIPGPKVSKHPLRMWQKELTDKLKEPPEDRTIVFLVDLEGNSGKSWFMNRYCEDNQNCQILLPGKKADMALALNEDLRVLFVDAPRSKQGDFIQYDFLEEVKNGRIFSSKYDSRMKVFKVPHVVVAMNEYPKMDQLSADRYHIIEINQFNMAVAPQQQEEEEETEQQQVATDDNTTTPATTTTNGGEEGGES